MPDDGPYSAHTRYLGCIRPGGHETDFRTLAEAAGTEQLQRLPLRTGQLSEITQSGAFESAIRSRQACRDFSGALIGRRTWCVSRRHHCETWAMCIRTLRGSAGCTGTTLRTATRRVAYKPSEFKFVTADLQGMYDATANRQADQFSTSGINATSVLPDTDSTRRVSLTPDVTGRYTP